MGTPETPERINKASKEKKSLWSSFDTLKNAVDAVKSLESQDKAQTEKDLQALENAMETAPKQSESHQGSSPKTTKKSDSLLTQQQQIKDRIARHPERPQEVAEAALNVLNTIAQSDQDPNQVAKVMGKVMKFILGI